MQNVPSCKISSLHLHVLALGPAGLAGLVDRKSKDMSSSRSKKKVRKLSSSIFNFSWG